MPKRKPVPPAPKRAYKYRFSDLVKGSLRPGDLPAGVPPLPSELMP